MRSLLVQVRMKPFKRFFLFSFIVTCLTSLFGVRVAYAYCLPEQCGSRYDPVARKTIYYPDCDSGFICVTNCCIPKIVGGGGGGGGGGCFPPGTIVKTPTGGTPIQSVKTGDTVTSFNDQTNKISESKVSDIYEVQRTYYFSIIAGGYHVTVTAEHPFFIGDGKYQEAQNLKTGDVLYVDQSNLLVPTVIAQNLRINEPTNAYNLTVDNFHTFFANDFAVHPKGGRAATLLQLHAMLAT